MFSVARYVDQAVKSLNAQKAVEFHQLKEAWLGAVGPVIAGQAEPTRIRGGVLHVTVSSPAWSQEIQMQQRLILGRLKEKLSSPPNKIACWVGQPHAAANAGPGKGTRRPGGEPPPWANTPIPQHRRERIEATLAELSEPTQREKLRPLIEVAVQRELYYLELGQLPCPQCGAMRPAEDDYCQRCLAERQAEADNRLMRVMAKKPWLKIRDLQDVAPWASRGHILRLRKALHSNLLMQAWQLSEGSEGEALEAKMSPEYRRLLVGITMLRCYVPPASLRPFHFTHALGKRLAGAYLAESKKAAGEDRPKSR